jgi:predicted MFS family arabinose efflux permease
MGGGGIGTAIGGRVIAAVGLDNLFLINGIALAVTLLLSFAMIRDHVVESDERKEMVGNL